MKILNFTGGEYQDCIVKHFDLLDYDTDKGNRVLYWGWNSLYNSDAFEKYKDRIKYFINTAQPCEIINGLDDIVHQENFTEIFTICPYTAAWLNKKQHTKKHVPIFFPFNEE